MCGDNGSLEVLAVTTDKIYKMHVRPVIAKVSHESAEVTEVQRQLAASTNNVATLTAALDASRSAERSQTRVLYRIPASTGTTAGLPRNVPPLAILTRLQITELAGGTATSISPEVSVLSVFRSSRLFPQQLKLAVANSRPITTYGYRQV